MNAQMTFSKVSFDLGSHVVSCFDCPICLSSKAAHLRSLFAAHGMSAGRVAQNPQIIPAE